MKINKILLGFVITILVLTLVIAGTSELLVSKDLPIDKTTKNILTTKNITSVIVSNVTQDTNPNWGKVTIEVNGFRETRHFNLGKPFNQVNESYKELKTQEAIKSFTTRIANNDSETIKYAKLYTLTEAKQ